MSKNKGKKNSQNFGDSELNVLESDTREKDEVQNLQEIPGINAGDAICFEEFRAVAVKLFSALAIRPEGQLSTIMQLLYSMLAVCFPERFEDVVIHESGRIPTVYFNRLSRQDILNPNGVDSTKVERHPIGSWPGYRYSGTVVDAVPEAENIEKASGFPIVENSPVVPDFTDIPDITG